MFKPLKRKISTPVAITIIVLCAVLIGGIVAWRYFQAPPKESQTLIQKEEIKSKVSKVQKETPSQKPIPEKGPAGWKIYRDEKYGFEVMYPATGWNLFSDTIGSILNEPLELMSLITQREGITTSICFCVYKKDTNLSMVQWLSSNLQWLSPDVSKAQRGDLNMALQKANAGETNLLSYNESKNNDIEISEFGNVDPFGYFDYATLYHKVNSIYVYSIELSLPLHSLGVSDPDEKYTDVYKQILSTFRFLE
jgi:hypothetical protein